MIENWHKVSWLPHKCFWALLTWLRERSPQERSHSPWWGRHHHVSVCLTSLQPLLGESFQKTTCGARKRKQRKLRTWNISCASLTQIFTPRWNDSLQKYLSYTYLVATLLQATEPFSECFVLATKLPWCACNRPISPNLAKQRCGKCETLKLQDLFSEGGNNPTAQDFMCYSQFCTLLYPLDIDDI